MLINTNKIKKNQGLTLIESLVVVGILLGIIAIALTLYGTVRDRLNVKNESENVSFIFSQMADLFSDETVSITQSDAINAGVYPNKMKISGTNVYNVWGGAVTIAASGTNGFQLTYKNVPSGSVCVDLVRNQRKVGWTSGAGVAYSTAGLNAAISTACRGANSGAVQDVVFIKS